VQGVGFRYFVDKAAGEHRATGWVRNRGDGSVEVLAEGSEAALTNLLDAIRRGPRGAHVTDVQVEWGEGAGAFTTFQIRSSG
jgi:acylphosphatase